MRLKVLGAYGASDAEHNLTGYLLDDWLAVDAGTLTSKLSFAQQARVQAVFISHPHADHIRDVMDLLMKNVFNGVVWPDFSSVTAPATGKAVVQYRALAPGKKVVFNGVS